MAGRYSTPSPAPIQRRSISTCIPLLSLCSHRVSPLVQLCIHFAINLVITAPTGALNIYNISNSLEKYPPEPLISHQLETTLISAISIAYPSSHPNILASASRSGILSLTELRPLSVDSVSTSKVCQGPSHLPNSPLAETFITASGVDGNAYFDADHCLITNMPLCAEHRQRNACCSCVG